MAAVQGGRGVLFLLGRRGEVAQERIVEEIGETLREIAHEPKRIAEHVEAENEHVGLVEYLKFVVGEKLVVQLFPRDGHVANVERLETKLDILELGDGRSDRLQKEVENGVGRSRFHLFVVRVRGAVHAKAQVENDRRQVNVVETYESRLLDALLSLVLDFLLFETTISKKTKKNLLLLD